MAGYSLHPLSISEYRATTERNAKSMAGVYWPTRRCSVCNKNKKQAGSTVRNGKFVCAECKGGK